MGCVVLRAGKGGGRRSSGIQHGPPFFELLSLWLPLIPRSETLNIYLEEKSCSELTLDYPTGCYLPCFFHSLAGKKKKGQLTDMETKLPGTCLLVSYTLSTGSKSPFS